MMHLNYKRMIIHSWTVAAGALLVAMTCLGADARPPDKSGTRKPNIILMMADDYGVTGMGCYGGAFKTPHLDEMAKTGVRFESCYSAPLCAPSRAMLMTGRFNFRTGSTGNSARAITPQTETSLAKTLKNAGYATAVAGKWSQLTLLSTPEQGKAWGFDEFMVWDHTGERNWKPALNRNGKPVDVTEQDYGPDILNDYVLDFAARNRDKPFFVYYPLTLIHSPLAPTPDGVSGNGQLADNIAYMDKIVGRLLDGLDKLNLRENTLVIFTGDNGNGLGGKINGKPIDGNKGSLREGGSRVPLVANWKGTTPQGKAPTDLVELTDVYATFVELAGAEPPSGVTMDSISFAPQLKGEPGTPRKWVFIQLREEWYARNKRWKLYRDGKLFDMKDAPFREIPVPDDTDNAEAKAAKKELQAVLDELKPSANKAGDSKDRGIKKEKSERGK